MGLNQRRMKQSGRAHWLVILGAVGFIALVGLLFAGGSAPSPVAGEFMVALAKGDVNKLTELTYKGTKSEDEIKKDWDFTVHTASPYYRFTWKINDEHLLDDRDATVRLDVWRNMGPRAYPEHYEIPLVKVNGAWKVRVEAINREMYPNLPRM